MQSIQRCYHLPLSPHCSALCRFCDLIGCRDQVVRGVADVERSLRRAQSGEFARVSFPANLLDFPEWPRLLALCRNHQMQPVLSLDWRVFTNLQPELTENLKCHAHEMGLELLFAGDEVLDRKTFLELSNAFKDVHYRLIPLRGQKVNQFLRQIPEESIHCFDFHFPPFVAHDPRRLSVLEVYQLTENLRREFPTLKICGPKGREVWDSRINPDLCLEPNLTPQIRYQIAGSQPLISVVIPSYNSGRLLKNVLNHLLQQTLPRKYYEVIVVDDGSTDSTEQLVRNFMAPEANRVNFQFVHFPRARERQMGDGNFRAGIARNQGAKLASGELLSFLDSDIITPPHFLAQLIELHKRWDVIQNVRHHLRNEDQNEYVLYNNVDPRQDTYIEEHKYWGPFFATQDWGSLPYHWKYTCSYGLSVKMKHFKETGWFRRTFVYYGFEDTDLGYRMHQMGRRFYLNPTVVYHLYPEKRRSEYRKSSLERHLLLEKTAKIFYLNNLDPQIFEHLRSFMYGELSWRQRLRHWHQQRFAEPQGVDAR